MALRTIRKHGDELLRKRSKEVDAINERILTLLNDMEETMYDADGVGLAAPQVGILKRVVVIDIGEGILRLINPEIISTEGSYVDVEGCLSVPGEQGEVERPYKVKVKALNEKGEEIIVEGEELLARALCHEIDHLEGVLFIDKVISDKGGK
jgi:peptide deformylase